MKQYRLINSNNKKYVYIADNGYVIHVDENSLKAIDAASKGLSGDELSQYLISSGVDVNLSKALTEKMSSVFAMNKNVMQAMHPHHLVLMVAQCCNLACKYCFGDEGTYHQCGMMTDDVAKAAIDYLMKNSDQKVLSVCFFGGEPLLAMDLIKKTIAYCHDLEQDVDIKFVFSITTNATLFTPEIIEFFKKENVLIQVSIDGDKSMNDKNRVYKDGRGSYEDVIRTTESLRQKNNSTKSHATISMDNLKPKAIFDHLISLNFCESQIVPAFSDIPEEKIHLLTEKMDELIDHLYELIKAGNYEDAKKMRMQYKVLKQLHTGHIRNYHCGAGTNMLTVDINGDVYPCHRLVSNGKAFCLGNLVAEPNQRFYSEIAKQPDQCTKCWCHNFCAGGCPAANDAMTHNAKLPSKAYCQYMRHYIMKLLTIYVQLIPEQKNALFD